MIQEEVDVITTTFSRALLRQVLNAMVINLLFVFAVGAFGFIGYG
jgi:hypothetical protein